MTTAEVCPLVIATPVEIDGLPEEEKERRLWHGLHLQEWQQNGSFPKNGLIGVDGVVWATSINWPVREYLSLQLDPARNGPKRGKNVSAELIDSMDHPKSKKRLWNTPRWGKTDKCRTLTVRSERDLPTTCFYEVGTPFCESGVLNPDWVDWLMAYPIGFSSAESTLVPQPMPCPSAPTRRLKMLDVFSGMGGISLGLAPWFESVAYCDVDPHSRAVLQARQADGCLDKGPVFDDIRTLDAEKLHAEGITQIDAICGGFPCKFYPTPKKNHANMISPTRLQAGTGISAAGKKDGLKNVQTTLYFEMLRLIDELELEVAIFENVARITCPAMSKDLAAVLDSLRERGFKCRYVSMHATNVGAPQTRNRWFLLATRGSANTHDFDVKPLSADSIKERFFSTGASEPVNVPRQIDGSKLTKEEARNRKYRLMRAGNSVLPSMVTVAFETMVAGFEQAVEQAEPKQKKRRM